MLELLQTIALLCQAVPSTGEESFVRRFSPSDVRNSNATCQQRLLKCAYPISLDIKDATSRLVGCVSEGKVFDK